MKRRKPVKAVIYIVFAIIFVSLAQSCNTRKKCGCGADLNGVYKHKRFR